MRSSLVKPPRVDRSLLSLAIAPFLLSIVASSAFARERTVSSSAEIRQAFGTAVAGDTIIVAPGTYDFDESMWTHNSGTAGQPITVRADTLGEVRFDFHSGEAVVIDNAYWVLDRLWINAACADIKNCETGIGVKPTAHHFLLLHARTTDWYQHVKASRETNAEVEDASIVGCEMYNTGDRYSQVIDIVGGKRWRIIGNYVHDWNGSDNGAFGIFLKGGTSNGVIEQNLVICEKDRASTGAMVGISLGQGGTGTEWCANDCACEDIESIVRNNIVAHCSDAGLHALRACGGKFLNNTVYDTLGGLQVQEDSTMAPVEIRNNLMSERIFGGTNYVESNNLLEVGEALFDAIYAGPGDANFGDGADISSVKDRGMVLTDVTADYCGTLREGSFDFGAIEFPAKCATWPWDAQRMADPLPGTGGGGHVMMPGRPGSGGEEMFDNDAGELTGSCACSAEHDRASSWGALFIAFSLLGLRRKHR